MKPHGSRWHPGGGSWRPPVQAPPLNPPPPLAPRGGIFGGRRRPSAKRTVTPREAAHRLWPDKVAENPKDDKLPAKTPGQVMDDLLRGSRHKPINTDRDPLQ
jgi:hypothetical protein